MNAETSSRQNNTDKYLPIEHISYTGLYPPAHNCVDRSSNKYSTKLTIHIYTLFVQSVKLLSYQKYLEKKKTSFLAEVSLLFCFLFIAITDQQKPGVAKSV